MAIDIGEATLRFNCDTKQLDSYLAKIQRALQAARDVLNEEAPKEIHDLTENIQ